MDLSLEQISMAAVWLIALILVVAVAIGVFRRTCSIMMGFLSMLLILIAAAVILFNAETILFWLEQQPFWPAA